MGLLYHFIKNTSRILTPFFFGKFEILGKENIPKNHPYILSPNHQNSFLDAVVIGAFSKKPVTFLARSDAFVPPYDKILAALKMMPVYRLRDGFEKLKLNDITFEKCDNILKEGNPVLIFPESNTAHEFYLRPLSKGISRMAFQSQSKLEKDLYILPVGLNYGHHLYPFHKFSMKFGKPIRVNDFHEIHEQNQAKGLIAIRKAISDGMKSTLLIPTKDEDYEQKKNIFNRKYENMSFEERKQLLNSPEKIQEEHYNKRLSFLANSLMIPNLPPFMLMYYLLGQLKDLQFVLSYKFVFALLIFPLWWVIIVVLTSLLASIQWAGILLLVCLFFIFLRQFLRKRIQ